ncbi:MCE family protein [Amycolatopsis sp. K13G38]|uniref:MCE family protein n=1 Tax=Amycolatopsis acididurans TaxID=2724524 RepID=A0ABX1IWU4_9PSEU|nr:MCE family protein [Amycolatopsis acididurans]NKQ51951.1 MCE family protein [Amycolatopsis acididurans]
MKRRSTFTALLIGSTLAVTGCQPGGVGALPLPGTQGRSDGSYAVTVELADASELYPNSVVMVDNVNVGTVTQVRRQGWHANLTVSLNPDVNLPANAVATVGQTSLLGAKHLALEPPTTVAPQGKLAQGATISLSQSHDYPDTEDVLASVSLLLNGGGLQQVQTITTELNKALGNGRDEQVRQTLQQLNTFMGTLDRQKDDITAALTGLDRLGAQAEAHNQVISDVLTQMPTALQTLNDERAALTNALNSLGNFSDAATGTVNDVRDTLTRNLQNLTPVLQGLADAGHALVGSTGLLATGLFPLSTNKSLFKGDYANLSIILDFTNSAISKYYLSLLKGTPLGDVLPGLGGSSGDPLQAPTGGPYQGMGGSGPLPAPPPDNAHDPSQSAGGVNDVLNGLLGGLGGGQ